MAKRDPDRDRRLAEALRANLRRRKAKAREGTAGAAVEVGERREEGGGGCLHQPAADGQVRTAPQTEAMPGGHGDLPIPPRSGGD